MVAYKVIYETKRPASFPSTEGEWTNKTSVVVVENDGNEAVDLVQNRQSSLYFRLVGVEYMCKVDLVSVFENCFGD